MSRLWVEWVWELWEIWDIDWWDLCGVNLLGETTMEGVADYVY